MFIHNSMPVGVIFFEFFAVRVELPKLTTMQLAFYLN